MNLTDEEIELVLKHRELEQAIKEGKCIHDFSGTAKVPYGGYVNACWKCGRLQ
jgi:hypothetical protein